MTGSQDFLTFAAILADVFDIDPAKITREATAADIDGWDSVSHATLIMAIEEFYGFTFSDLEIFSFADVGALFDRSMQLRTR